MFIVVVAFVHACFVRVIAVALKLMLEFVVDVLYAVEAVLFVVVVVFEVLGVPMLVMVVLVVLVVDRKSVV